MKTQLRKLAKTALVQLEGSAATRPVDCEVTLVFERTNDTQVQARVATRAMQRQDGSVTVVVTVRDIVAAFIHVYVESARQEQTKEDIKL